MPLKSAAARAIAADTSRTPWISIEEAATIAGVNTKTIRRWIAADYLAAKRFGPKLIRIDATQLDAMGTTVG